MLCLCKFKHDVVNQKVAIPDDASFTPNSLVYPAVKYGPRTL